MGLLRPRLRCDRACNETSQWMSELRSVRRSALRLERQAYYAIELEVYERWRAGDHRPPVDEPGFAEWYALLDRHVAHGRTVARVRMVEEPPTDYQRFEHWCGQRNVEHGEELRSMPRSVAEAVGLVEAGVHLDDWWLLDDSRLLVMPFDQGGNLDAPYLVTDRQAVEAALAEWRIAVEHSDLDDYATTR